MFLCEMKQAAAIEWGTPMFDGANNARAKISTPTGDITAEFDEREGGSVELSITGENINFESLDGISQIIRAYKSKHPDVPVKLANHDNASKFVGRYLQGILD